VLLCVWPANIKRFAMASFLCVTESLINLLISIKSLMLCLFQKLENE